MTDQELIQLIFLRDEQGLSALQECYATWCGSIIFRLLENEEDTQEALNELWLRIWNSIPPARPENLKAYLAKAARNTAIHYLERESAQKRQHISILLSELSDCLPDPSTSRTAEAQVLRDALNGFVRGLSPREREVFVYRYWYGESIADLQNRMDWTQSRITSLLYRLRKRLKKHLEREGVWNV